MHEQHCSHWGLGLTVALVRPVDGIGLQDSVQVLLPKGSAENGNHKPAPNPGPEFPYKFQANLQLCYHLAICLPSPAYQRFSSQSILGPSLSPLAAYPINLLPIPFFICNHPQSNHNHFLQELVITTVSALLWNHMFLYPRAGNLVVLSVSLDFIRLPSMSSSPGSR